MYGVSKGNEVSFNEFGFQSSYQNVNHCILSLGYFTKDNI